MNIPTYTPPPHKNNKVEIRINGVPVSSHKVKSKRARHINFVGNIKPLIKENDETDSFDISFPDIEKRLSTLDKQIRMLAYGIMIAKKSK